MAEKNKDIVVTINSKPENPITINQWCLMWNDEGNRVCVKHGNKEYSLVLGDKVKLEVWSLDSGGELLDIEKELDLS